jgi:hypothetical protein
LKTGPTLAGFGAISQEPEHKIPRGRLRQPAMASKMAGWKVSPHLRWKKFSFVLRADFL